MHTVHRVSLTRVNHLVSVLLSSHVILCRQLRTRTTTPFFALPKLYYHQATFFGRARPSIASEVGCFRKTSTAQTLQITPRIVGSDISLTAHWIRIPHSFNGGPIFFTSRIVYECCIHCSGETGRKARKSPPCHDLKDTTGN